MAEEESLFMKELEKLLAQHEVPQVGDIRTGYIISMSQQEIMVDLGLKRDGIVPQSDVQKLSDDERAALKVNDEIAVYVVNTEATDNLVVSIYLAKLNQDWIDAEALLESGDTVELEVGDSNTDGVVVPFGRLMGFVPASHLTELPSGLSAKVQQQLLNKLRGQKLSLKVIEVDRRRSRLIFSQFESYKDEEPNEERLFMEELEKLLDQHDYELPQVGDIRTGYIISMDQQGMMVDLGVKRDGIVPQSDIQKLSDEERAALKVNDEIAVYIVNTEETDSLVVSIHLAKLNQDWIDAEALLESGNIVELEIGGYNKGGAIVPFGRLRGFVPASHLTELSPGMNDRKRQQRLAKLRGEKLPLKVIEVDRRRRRLVFSQKDAQKEWEEKRKQELIDSLKVGDVLKGTISGMRDFGAFVDVGGADGLVHISELAWHRVDHPRDVVKVGDEIDVYVLSLDKQDQRISLSRKKLLPNPWETVEERYEVNQLVEGTITRIVNYGAFAEVEPGIEGLLHLSQLSRGNVDRADEVVKEGETHLLRVVSIDRRRQRMGLSLKAVTTTEQIEWMAQRELEKVQEAEPEAISEVEQDGPEMEDVEEIEVAIESEPAEAATEEIDEAAKAAVDALVDESELSREEE